MTTGTELAERPPLAPPGNQALAPVGDTLLDDALFAPFDVDKAKQRLALIQRFFSDVMHGPKYKADGKTIEVEGEDWGPAYPGAKAVILYRAGSDKFKQFLGVVSRPEVVSRVEDWGRGKNEIAFFHFEVRVDLVSLRTGRVVAHGIGSCNTREVKYRYRNEDRKCPDCGAAAIRRSKFPPRSNPNGERGWYCHDKAGGCGAQFGANDPKIVDQVVGRAENTEIADLHHTVLRDAKKRADNDAVTTISRAIGFLVAAVDPDDDSDDDQGGGHSPKDVTPTQQGQAKASGGDVISESQRDQLFADAARNGHDRSKVVEWLGREHGVDLEHGIPKAAYLAAMKRIADKTPIERAR